MCYFFSCNFISLSLFVFTFAMKLKSANYKIHWNVLALYDHWKIMSDLDVFHGKLSGFVSFPSFGFTLVIKLKNFDLESHWNTLTFLDKKRYSVRFKDVTWKNVWIFFISIVWVHFIHKTKKFGFGRSLKYFNVFWFDYVPSNSVWFGLSFNVCLKSWQ